MSALKEFKVIDFHIHIGLKEHWHSWVHDYQKSAGSDLYERYNELIDPRQFADYLISFGIKKAVILPEISPTTTGIVPNEYVLEFCQGMDIYLPFCTINPSTEDKLDSKVKGYIQKGAKGIKLYPSYNFFYPNDKNLYPVYELAQKHRLPVLVHTGSSIFRGSKIKYANPLHLDDVAADFPDCKILMAHGGRGLWYQTAFFLSRLHPNLYIEISGLPPKNLLKYFPELEKNIDKIVYGSDWPGVRSAGINIDSIKKLPLAETSIQKILYKNAAGILGFEALSD